LIFSEKNDWKLNFLKSALIDKYFFTFKNNQKNLWLSFGSELGGVVSLRYVPGGLWPSNGTLPSATTTDLSQNSNKFLSVLKGKKIFSNWKVIKEISKLFCIFLSTHKIWIVYKIRYC
jgi:hypothetical protein